MKITKFGKTLTVKNWKGERLTNRYIGLDTETPMIQDRETPKLVITCAYDGSDNVWIITNHRIMEFLSLHSKHTFILHNFYFDMKVITAHCGWDWIPQIEAGLIYDTQLLFKLAWIGTYGYTLKRSSLDFCVEKLLNEVLPKDNDIRLTFGQFIRKDGSIAYNDISNAHLVYALLDPVATLLVFFELKRMISLLPTSTMCAHKIHLMGDIALKDISDRGLNVDTYQADVYRSYLELLGSKPEEALNSYGYFIGKKGNKKVYDQIMLDNGIDSLPITKTGNFSQKVEDLDPYINTCYFVKAFIDYMDLKKEKDFLRLMVNERIYPDYDSIKKTGRTGCKRPNIQNPPRRPGIRNCFLPKRNHVFVDADYSSIEMYTQAYYLKTLYGESNMYDQLQLGKDLHIFVGSSIYNVSEDNVDSQQRQSSKIANYGFLSGMTAQTFVDYSKQLGAKFTLDEAKFIRAGWVKAYPEIEQHWLRSYKEKTFISDSGFVRANCGSTHWLNTHFQGKAAEGAKLALWLLYKEKIPSVAFIHDQIILESPIDLAHDHAKALKRCMEEGMKLVCPMNIEVDTEFKYNLGK